MHPAKVGNVDWTTSIGDTTSGGPATAFCKKNGSHARQPTPWWPRFSRSNVAITVVQSSAAARREKFVGSVGPPNHFVVFESAVNLYIPPLEFATKAEIILDVDRALAILGEIGFEDLPVRIRGKDALRHAI